jgi:Holliday junction resolvase RusA-like endonuclease
VEQPPRAFLEPGASEEPTAPARQLAGLPARVVEVTFFAAGTAKPKGSHRAMLIGGAARIAPASAGERGWRAAVSNAAAAAMRAARVLPLDCAVEMHLEFYSARPKSHYRTNGALKPTAPARPTSAPDADKLARSVGDALNGVCYRDDALICELRISKHYCDEANPYCGVRVTVRPFGGVK